MISREKEKVVFSNNIETSERNVEDWIADIENEMKIAVEREINDCLLALSQE